jgi:SpoVK/Ycf46/Vps4 family AAA+-type ATPase
LNGQIQPSIHVASVIAHGREDDMAWASELEKHPEHLQAIGMISVENSNLEIALADLMGAILLLPRRIAHAIYFEPRAAALRIGIFKAATTERLKPSRSKKATAIVEVQKREALARAKRLANAALSATQRRHDIIHDAWGSLKGAVYRQKIGETLQFTGQPVDINTLRVLVRDFRELIDEAHSLAAEFRARPPTMVDLRLE